MLTVYSTYGSPGASTTAVYLAAQWASTGRQVLLIEADGAAGTLSQKLGVQFTPGTASFIASSKGVTAADLIDHAQDVLFSDLHLMPTPSSPSGAKTVAEKFAHLGEELRDVSDSEMAVIVDAGRLTAQARTSELTTSAAAVLVVTRDEAQVPSLEHVHDVLVENHEVPGPLGLVVTVGPSALKEGAWRSEYGLNYVGSIELTDQRGTDLSMFMPRAKRKSRKLRGSIEKLADALYDYACPASAASPRPRLPAARPGVEEAEQPDTSAADANAAAPAADADPQDLLGEAPLDPRLPEMPADYAPAPTPAPTPDLQVQPAMHHGQPPYPEYAAPAPHPGHGGYPDSSVPVSGQGHSAPPHYAYPEPPQPPPLPPSGHSAPGYPPVPPQQAPQYRYPGDEQAGQWWSGHGHSGHEPGYAPPAPHYQAYEAPPPMPPPDPYLGHDMGPAPQPVHEVPSAPSGSFRSWAEQLFGDSAGTDSAGQPSDPGEGATA